MLKLLSKWLWGEYNIDGPKGLPTPGLFTEEDVGHEDKRLWLTPVGQVAESHVLSQAGQVDVLDLLMACHLCHCAAPSVQLEGPNCGMLTESRPRFFDSVAWTAGPREIWDICLSCLRAGTNPLVSHGQHVQLREGSR